MRPWVKIAIAVLVPVAAYFAYDSIAGHWLVQQLCAKDGGLRIHEKTFADGYLDESETNPYACLGCFWKLAKHEFKYVDVRDRGRTPGYFRFSLAQTGDPRCEPSKQTFMRYGWARLQKSAGIPADQCVAVEALPERPAGAVMTHTVRGHGSRGVPNIAVDEWRIANTATGRLAAELREYLFYSRWDSALSFGPTNPAARCFAPAAKLNAIRDLLPATLRDQSRRVPDSNAQGGF